MNEIVVLGGFAVVLTALSSWRLALLLTLCVGFAQDVVRKLTPGEPVHLVMLFGIVFAIAALGLVMRGGTLSLRPMFLVHPRLRWPVTVFVCIVAAQVVWTLARTGSVVIAGIGTMVYLLPFGALVVAMYYATDSRAMARAFVTYAAMSVVFSAGVYLNVAGFQDGVLDSVGSGLYVYPEEGGVLKLPSGLFRSAEIAAWHGATAAALVGLLVLTRLMPGGTIAGVVLLAFLVGAVLLTGRRKMVVELVIFVIVFAAMLAFYRRRGLRLGVALAALALVVYVGQLALLPSQERLRPYVSRYETVAGEATERLRTTTVDSFRWVIQRNGLLGAGAGMGSQGASHFGGGARAVGYAAEGGLSKLLAELGVHGLAAALWVVAALAVSCHASIRRLGEAGDGRRATLAVGLAALLLSNVAVYATASQVFGDPFVLLVLGLCLGFVLRAPPATPRAPARAAPA